MTQAHDLSVHRATLDALPADGVRTPNLPVHVFIQEAENLYHWCQKDRDALLGAGLDWQLVEALPLRARVLRAAESLWFGERYSREQAEQDWNQLSPAAYELRDRLLRAMRYGYRNDAALLKRVAEIAAGTGHADMIQDLNDIAYLGRNHPAPLEAIKLELAELDRAISVALDMGALLARVNGDRMENSASKNLRDRAYTWLRLAVEDVRACGQYVFYNNAERRPGYGSQYFRGRRGSTGSEAQAPEVEAVL